MPCNTLTSVKLALEKANMTLLRKAIESIYGTIYTQTADYMSWPNGSYDRNKGMLTVRSESKGNEIRRAYSTQIVKQQAARFGWQVKSTGTNQFELNKR